MDVHGIEEARASGQLPAPGPIAVRVVDSACAISDGDWRRVTAGKGFYSSPQWLRAVELDPWHDVWYVTARGADGSLAGVLPVYLPSGPSRAGADAFYDPAAVFGLGPGGGATGRWSPALLAGGRAGYDVELLLDDGLDAGERRLVLHALTGRLAALAEAWDADLTAVMYLRPRAVRELAAVLGGTPLLTDVSCAIPVDGLSSMEDYVQGLSGHRRGRVRREMRDFAACRLSLDWTDLQEAGHLIAPLLAAHHHRYGHADTPAMLTRYLDQQAQALSGMSRVLLCRDAGRLVGALVAFEHDRTWYARVVAAGEGLRGSAFAFFSLVFYAPLAEAISRGIRRYVLGPSSLESKVHRGAIVEPRWSLLAGAAAGAVDVRRLEETWNAACVPRWAELLHRLGVQAHLAAPTPCGPAADC